MGTNRADNASAKAVAVYEAAISDGRVSCDELTFTEDGSATSRADLLASLTMLTEIGLLRRGNKEGHLYPVAPESALLQHIEQLADLQEQLSKIRTAETMILNRFAPAAARAQEQITVAQYHDREQRAQALADMLAAAQDTSDSLHPGPLPANFATLENSLQMDAEAVQRGIAVRAVYAEMALQTPLHRRYLHDLAGIGVKVRVIDEAPYDLLSLDRSSVIVPGDRTASMKVITGALAMPLVQIMDDYWRRAVPLAQADGGLGRTPREREIIRLLREGLSDEQIGTRLKKHRRTVQRDITSLMEEFEVDNRFALGYALGRAADDTFR